MAAQRLREETAWEQKVAAEGDPMGPPYKRLGVERVPYYYIGWPFVHNSIQAVEIALDKPPAVVSENDLLKVTQPIDSPGLQEAIAEFNAKNYAGALQAVGSVREESALPAKAIMMLWLAGRLETDFELDNKLVASAANVLEKFVADHPDEIQTAEILDQAKTFVKAYEIHWTRGDYVANGNHFAENGKAIGWWWMIPRTLPCTTSRNSTSRGPNTCWGLTFPPAEPIAKFSRRWRKNSPPIASSSTICMRNGRTLGTARISTTGT